MMKKLLALTAFLGLALLASAQEHLQKGALASSEKKSFTTLKKIPVTGVKNQHRSGTCWALNTLIGLGKKEDWMVHMIGHSVGAWTHAPHGYTLAAVSMAYYRRAMENGLPKFARFAHNVWGIPTEGKTERELAEAGLKALKEWMLEIGLPLTISELGATEDMIPGITETTVVYPAGYLNLTKEDVAEILKESM